MNRVIMDNMAILEHKMNVGEARGVKKGRIEGEVIGMKKGKIELAKRLLQNGVAIDMIAQSADLSKEQIESLQKCVLAGVNVVNF
ncbi:hypothetical protein [Candidatus Rhabdochlamydia porcellionis]|uniref:Transposase n=1 Tax=Candidatus Rhabdochlamydia porcellionis TaxID=225148 RepID=A0ABX8YZV9_9BACT|nr:hypothetical protein [Candidatus Rhabdochlamydia porcellionis]QZA58887.1 hypothetical protein RHAB15C_0000768 [Candidatus Rhabdochlamydia porcellionis]